MHEHRVFDSPRLQSIHVRRNANRLRKIRQPEGKVNERISIFQKRASSCLRFAVAPSLVRRAKLILPGTHSHDASQLAALQETTQLLHVASEPVIVSDYDFSVSGLSSRENPVHSARRERKRSLAEYVNLRFESAKHVRLVKMIGRRDNYRIELIRIEKLIDVGENVGNTKTLGESARFWSIIVANRDEFSAPDFRQNGKMRELCDRAGTNQSKPNFRAHSVKRPTVVPGK
jgi:hypothetical protein